VPLSRVAELIRRGWTDEELKLLAGENLLRVLQRAEQLAMQLQTSTPASMTRMEVLGP